MLSSGQDFGKKFLDSKHVLKVYLKHSRKNPKISFLPFCSELVRLKILHLTNLPYSMNFFDAAQTTLSFKIIIKIGQAVECTQGGGVEGPGTCVTMWSFNQIPFVGIQFAILYNFFHFLLFCFTQSLFWF